MRLYFKIGASSLATRITLEELGLPYAAEMVDTANGTTETGRDFRTINPRGYVPALELDDGVVLTENPAILQYLADTHADARLAPAPGTTERAHLQAWLNFIASELHKAFNAFLSDPQPTGDEANRAHARLARRIGDVEAELRDGRRFALGDQFSVADAYLFVILNWCGFIGVDLSKWPATAAYFAHVAQRSAVRRAMVKEGLLGAELPA